MNRERGRAHGKRDKYFALADSVVRSGFRLVAAVLLARLGGPEVYAGYVLLFAGEIIATAIPSALVLQPLLSVAPGLPPAAHASFLRRLLARHVRWSWRLGAVAMLTLPLTTPHGIPPLAHVGFAVALALASVANGIRARQQALFCARSTAEADAIGLGIPIVATFVWYAVGLARGPDVLTVFFWTLAAGWTVAIARMQHGMAARLTVQDDAPADALERVATMGPPMVVGSVANSACSRVQPFVLAAAAGSGAVSLFGSASTLVGPLRLLSMAFAGVLRPRLALHAGTGNRAGVRRALTRTLGLFAGLGIVATASAAWFGEPVAVFVFGERFQGVGRALPFAALFATLEAVGATLVVALHTLHPRGAHVATTWRVSLSLVALAVVWPACAWGRATGAFLALCGTELAFVACAAWALRSARPQRPPTAADDDDGPQGRLATSDDQRAPAAATSAASPVVSGHSSSST